MWYLGGKMRQSKEIVKAVRYLGGKTPNVYVEPFCGALWSATAVMKEFPDWKYAMNDVNPFLIRFWQDAKDGWDPPELVSEATYVDYNTRRPANDPMTGYVGFAWSFGGKFFGGAARTNGKIKGSYGSTKTKIDMLRQCDVEFSSVDYLQVPVPMNSIVYMDPPYVGRTKQRAENQFDHTKYVAHCEYLVKRRNSAVIATEFQNPAGWELLHDWGDTVVRHLNAKPKDGTRELLMRVVA